MFIFNSSSPAFPGVFPSAKRFHCEATMAPAGDNITQCIATTHTCLISHEFLMSVNDSNTNYEMCSTEQ